MPEVTAQLFHDSAVAWRLRDWAFLQSLFADDIVWWVAGTNPLSGPKRGPGEVQAFFDALLELTDGSLAPTITGVCLDDRTAVMLTDLRGSRDGVEYSLPEALVYQFNDERKIADVRQFLFDPTLWNDICR